MAEPKAPDAEEIKFTTGKSALSTVLVARSAAGICAILIGDEIEALQRDLADEFTNVKLSRDDRALRADLDKVLSFIKTPTEGLDLPL
ncbi:MAG TPA: cysteine methyltransferase, partial [Xanthobacteraceae bacterium]|nr:cysteine methyltransferase [Xanthobacteraceae bacterium]